MIVETPGIGQGDAGIVDHVDVPIYVMTPEFGAASQLEKIDMLDFAEAVVINKFERRGAEDALRDVRRQLARNRERVRRRPGRAARCSAPSPPASTTTASPRSTSTSAAVLAERGLAVAGGTLAPVEGRVSTKVAAIVPPERVRYLAEIAEAVRGYHATTEAQVAAVRPVAAARSAPRTCWPSGAAAPPTSRRPSSDVVRRRRRRRAATLLDELAAARRGARRRRAPRTASALAASRCRARSSRASPSPATTTPASCCGSCARRTCPGRFPFTAGVFPLKRDGEDPARMFAGEGDAFRTNRRFHLLAEGQPATRLSTAFDSVTLYGFDPDERPDIYGKVGNSGVSIATLDDMEVLYDGFDLCDPSTSVSMTINGPAPTILAMFLNTAIDQHPELEPAEVLRRVRGTVQADILKEDQGQNTCIFSTEFASG